MQEKTRKVFTVSIDWVLKVRTLYACEYWEQRHAKYPTGEVTPGESLAPRNQPFPPQQFLLEPSSGPGLEHFFFCLRKMISSLSSWDFRFGTSSERPHIKVGKLILYKLGEENVLNLPEIDVKAAAYAPSVLAF